MSAAAMRSLTIAIEPTDRTDLPCIACGLFLPPQRKTRTFAIVTPAIPGGDPVASIHACCMPLVRRRRGGKP